METIHAKDLREVIETYGGAAEARPVMTETEITDFKQAKLKFEKSFFKKALDKFKGNITLTAQKIGMAQSNLSRKLKELGLR
jgi:DNA-binding NtrC family response regulator